MSSARSTEAAREVRASAVEPGEARPTRLVRMAPLLAGFVIWAVGSGIILTRTGDQGTTAVVVTLGWTAIVLTLAWCYRMVDSLLRPEGPRVRVAATGWRRKELEREKFWLLKAIKELEFDHDMRKVSDDDFKEVSARYRARAIRVMRELDAEEPDYRGMVERELAARMGAVATATTMPAAEPAPVKPPTKSPAAEPDEKVAAKSEEPLATAETGIMGGAAFDEVKSRGGCSCGAMNDDDAAFCKKCGRALA